MNLPNSYLRSAIVLFTNLFKECDMHQLYLGIVDVFQVTGNYNVTTIIVWKAVETAEFYRWAL